MNDHPYSYVVLRYVPDAGAGEALNVGVIVYSEEARFLRLQIDSRYERLSRAFAKFDGRGFRHAVENLTAVFRTAEKHVTDRPLFAGDRSLLDWLNALVPDTGASMAFTTPRHGIGRDLATETALLFERMVESQKGHADESPRRDDAQVWRSYAEKIPPGVSKHITKKAFSTPSVKVEFEHAVKNGAWHVIQPLSMDFRQGESMQRKASQWVGTAVGLQGVQDLGTIFFLVGKPSEGHPRAYERAKALLDQAPIKHEIIEEQDAEKFGRQLLDLIEHQR